MLLEAYRDTYRPAFAQAAAEAFNALVKASGLDIKANRRTISELRGLEAKAARLSGHRRLLAWLFGLLGLLGPLLLLAFLATRAGDEGIQALELVLVGLTFAPIWACAFILLRRLACRLAELQAQAAALEQTAAAQMAPLNALYTWDIAPRLISTLLPGLDFHPSLSQADYLAFRAHAGENFPEPFGDPTDAPLTLQSGDFRGNPFLYGRIRTQDWQTKCYTGTKLITWTSLERDSNGRLRPRIHTQLLRASIERPVPVYTTTALLYYAHAAAPALTFTHAPTGLAAEGDGFFARRRKARAMRALEDFSRNLDDDSQYTLMGNHDFELLFHATDRSDEVAFRQLFTPVAQQEMLSILRDTTIAYGDDFVFRKEGPANLITASHLASATLSTAPAQFHALSYDDARRHFLTFHAEYFRHFYATLAPLLAIPAYQTPSATPSSASPATEPPPVPSAWELQTLAYAYGERYFRPPGTETDCILKATLCPADGPFSTALITAHAFRVVPRVTYVSMLGNDGVHHQVAVRWEEYLPVERTRRLHFTTTPSPAFTAASAGRPALSRRTLHSFLP